jgi:hypothetical protein
MDYYDHELNETFGMRVLGALVALMVVGFLCFFVPAWAQIQFYVPLLWSTFNARDVHDAAHVVWQLWWIGALVAATVTGFAVGAGRMVQLLGYLWLTATPPDRRLTRRLWIIVGTMAAVTYVLVGIIAD